MSTGAAERDVRGRLLSRAGTGAMAVAVVVLVLVAVFVLGVHVFPSGLSEPRPGPGGVLVGEAEGWVGSAEPSTGVVRVSSGFLGLSSLSLKVTAQTTILVGGKEGGFDDLSEGRWVRAAYEGRPDDFRARSIEVVVGDRKQRRTVVGPTPSELPPASPPSPSADRHDRAGAVPSESAGSGIGTREGALERAAPGGAGRAGATPPPPARAPRRQAEPRPDARSPAAAPAPRGAARAPAGDERDATVPSRDGRAPATSGAAKAPAGDGRDARAPTSSSDGPGQPRETRRGHAEEADPGAVIDWLLQQRSAPRTP